MNRLDAPGGVSDGSLVAFIRLGWQLATQHAEASFRAITVEPGWTPATVQAEAEAAIERMDIGARDLLASKGADPGGENWLAIWTAMETAYRETTASLLIAAGARIGSTLQ